MYLIRSFRLVVIQIHLKDINFHCFQMLRTLLLRPPSPHQACSQYALIFPFPLKCTPSPCKVSKPPSRSIASGRNVLPILASRGLLQVAFQMCDRLSSSSLSSPHQGCLAPRRRLLTPASCHLRKGVLWSLCWLWSYSIEPSCWQSSYTGEKWKKIEKMHSCH